METVEARRPDIEITHLVIGCAYQVANALGSGFLEKVYENALAHEIRKRGLRVVQQHPITVRYDSVVVGEFVADLLVEDWLLVELKAVDRLADVHKAQCINYLRATELHICLLINFGSSQAEIRRIVHKYVEAR